MILTCLREREKIMKINTEGKICYSPDMTGDPLKVEKGYSHYNSAGQKDFLCRILECNLSDGAAEFTVETFRKHKANVKIQFISNTVFRLQMIPELRKSYRENSVFEFDSYPDVLIEYDADFITLHTDRVELKIRTCPWEITVFLDGKELTKEQIKDHNVDQKYKAVPIGYTIGDDGSVTDAFETNYLYSDEAFYGFGEKFTDFNKRGQKITVWQRDAQSTNSDISYKGMPYFMSSSGYAILLNTYTRSHFNMGASSHVSYTMETEDPYLDYYMFCNRDYKDLIKDYTYLSGRSPMIPRWSFGFWMSKMSYESREEIEDTVNKMAAFGMSVDVIHIDGWMDSWQPDASKDILTFDERRFPDPEGMINWLKERGVHLSLWMYPYIAATRIDRRTKKRIGESEQYKYMNSRGFLVKNNEGNTYVFGLGEGDVAGEGVAALDFTNPECVAYVSERVKRLMRMNVGVIKTDFSEEIPEDAVFYDGSTGLLGHNKYTLLYAKTIYEASRDEKEKMGQRALLWGRSGFSGSQNYPANWAGDSSAAKNNLSAILNGGLSIGISGVSFWGFDIGGFYNCDYQGNRVVPDDEDYIRSVQMGLMSPLSRSHGQGTPREPWIFSKTAQKAFLYINKLRYRLLPYIYSTAYETHYFGYPMMRAMILEYPEDLNVRNLSTQYMFGSSLLVAPVFDQQIQHVYLPHGSWVDMNTGEIIDGDRWIAPEKNIERIPVYLRSDSVIAMYETAPMHIDDRNFAGYDLIMNLDDHISASIFDDNNIGKVDVQQRNHEVIISTDSIDYSHIRIYSSDVIEKVIINGTEQEWTREGESLYI